MSEPTKTADRDAGFDPSVEDYVRATASAFGLDPDEAVKHLPSAAPNELRVAALAHVIEWYGGPDDDTIPVLRSWLRDLERVIPPG